MASPRRIPREPVEVVRDGCPLILVPLPKVGHVTVERPDYLTLNRLEYSPLWSERSNGKGAKYVHVHADDPRPIGGLWPTQEVARLIAGLMLLEEERETGKRAPERFRVRFRNGDHRDLRRANLIVEIGGRGRGGFRAIWGLRQRFKLVAQSESPTATFKARREGK